MKMVQCKDSEQVIQMQNWADKILSVQKWVFELRQQAVG